MAPQAPLARRDVLEPHGHEHKDGVPIGEGADHARRPADLTVQALNGVVGAYALPVLPRELYEDYLDILVSHVDGKSYSCDKSRSGYHPRNNLHSAPFGFYNGRDKACQQ